jgi:hypothetical protein
VPWRSLWSAAVELTLPHPFIFDECVWGGATLAAGAIVTSEALEIANEQCGAAVEHLGALVRGEPLVVLFLLLEFWRRRV